MYIRTKRNSNNGYSSDTLIKSPSYNLNRIQIHSNILREKVHGSKVSNGNKNRLDHKSFYQSKIKRLLHLSPEDCKNELNWLKLSKNKGTNRKLKSIQVFPDFVHQAKLEGYQGHIKWDNKYSFHCAHGQLAYDLLDKTLIPHIGKNTPSYCKEDTKNKGYQEKMFFDWKIQLEKYN